MARRSDRSPRPPLDQVFERVGTFDLTPEGAIIPSVTSEPQSVAPDLTDFQGGRPPASP